MSGSSERSIGEMRVDVSNLYQEEVFTDQRVASIRRLNPVKPDGSPDGSRDAMFIGQTNVMSAAGPLPIDCPIEAKTLEEAMQKFPEAVQQAVDRLIEHAEERQRDQSSRIVVPEAMPGKIQLP